MLSYLRDSQTPAAAEQMKESEANGESVCHQHDFLTVSGHGKRLRQSTIMLIALFSISALIVWFMVKKITPASANAAPSEDQTQLEAALAQLNTMQTEVNTQMDTVVGKFYQFSNVDQVEVNELKKNPFMREFSESGKSDGPLPDSELSLMREKARQEASLLELWSITSTPRGRCCMVNDKLLYAGDTINGMTVKAVGEKMITLDYNGILIELKMSE